MFVVRSDFREHDVRAVQHTRRKFFVAVRSPNRLILSIDERLESIWTPPFTQARFHQNKGAYVYSAFWWRCYLLALNVCAPGCLYEVAACKASFENRFHPGGWLYLIVGLLAELLLYFLLNDNSAVRQRFPHKAYSGTACPELTSPRRLSHSCWPVLRLLCLCHHEPPAPVTTRLC